MSTGFLQVPEVLERTSSLLFEGLEIIEKQFLVRLLKCPLITFLGKSCNLLQRTINISVEQLYLMCEISQSIGFAAFLVLQCCLKITITINENRKGTEENSKLIYLCSLYFSLLIGLMQSFLCSAWRMKPVLMLCTVTTPKWRIIVTLLRFPSF